MSLVRILDAVKGHQCAERLQALCSDLVRQNDALRHENAKLRTENRALRRRLHDSQLARLRRAEVDALLLGALYFAGLSTSATSASDYGISKRRWIAACGLLSLAKVRISGGGWRDVTPGDFETRLQGAVRRVESEGAEVWAANTARNGYSGLHSDPSPAEVTAWQNARRNARQNARQNAANSKRDVFPSVQIHPASGEVVREWSMSNGKEG